MMMTVFRYNTYPYQPYEGDSRPVPSVNSGQALSVVDWMGLRYPLCVSPLEMGRMQVLKHLLRGRVKCLSERSEESGVKGSYPSPDAS